MPAQLTEELSKQAETVLPLFPNFHSLPLGVVTTVVATVVVASQRPQVFGHWEVIKE